MIIVGLHWLSNEHFIVIVRISDIGIYSTYLSMQMGITFVWGAYLQPHHLYLKYLLTCRTSHCSPCEFFQNIHHSWVFNNNSLIPAFGLQRSGILLCPLIILSARISNFYHEQMVLFSPIIDIYIADCVLFSYISKF